MLEFKGQKYIEGTNTWTAEYDKWRRDNKLCNSPMAWALMKKAEKRPILDRMLNRRPRIIKLFVP